MTSSLAMLATVAVGDYDSDHDTFESLHIPQSSHSPSSSEASSRPLRRSSTSNTLNLKHKITHKATGKFAKALSLPRSQATAREDKVRRQKKIKSIIEQAQKIKSVGNSPVNASQLRLLRGVFQITKFPSEYWMAFIAVLIKRHFSQVKTWFSNQRQHVRTEQMKRKLPPDSVVTATTLDGVTIKFREEGLKLCPEWSDDLFEGVVSLHYLQR